MRPSNFNRYGVTGQPGKSKCHGQSRVHAAGNAGAKALFDMLPLPFVGVAWKPCVSPCIRRKPLNIRVGLLVQHRPLLFHLFLLEQEGESIEKEPIRAI